MNRDKQIEEMAKDICGRADCATCGELMPCFSKHFSKRAVGKGYRKASDVAREIIDDLESRILPSGKGLYAFPVITHEFIAELKKKYIGKDTNVTTNTEET